ncbi:MAG: LAGLIDADG family homing endonuclease, partial [Methyloceanibacter sp.]
INELHEAKCAGLSVTVPVQAALDLPDANLPIDPYLLGYWLGDGTYDRANITCNSSILLFVIRAAKNAGYAATSLKDRRANVHTVKITEGFHQALRQNELLRNKHIPAIYLRASVAQRRQILCGLMDSDGCIEKERGRAKFCSTSETLADDVYELAVSLGETPCRHSNEARGFGVTTVARWVEWQPTFPCVTLPHKVANLKQRKITPYRAIRNIERIDSVPTKCIAVTSPSETYLAGRSMAPTHNTVIRRLCKRLDQSPELTEALKIEDEAEFPSMRDITPPSERRAPPAPKPQLVAPSPKVGKRAPSPKKPAPEKRSGAPYGGKKPEAETEPEGQDAPPYDDEESQQQLTALRGELDQPLNRDELTEIVERWTSCVRRMQPKHQNLAVAALSVRVADVFEDEPGPSFFSDEAEEGETD